MVQILTTKYTKEEERIIAISGLSGTFAGLLLGVLLSYWIGFFTNLDPAITDPIGWAALLLKIGSIIVAICAATTFAICVSFSKNSIQKALKRMIPGILLFPLIISYTFLVMWLVFVPLNILLLQYLSPFLVTSVGALVFFPFVVVFVAFVMPDTPVGKALRRFVRRLKK
jgi:hypothetical protein